MKQKELILRVALWALIHAMGFPPIGLWPLSVIGILLLMSELFSRPSSSALIMAVFSYFTYLFGFYWIAYTIKEFGEMNWFVACVISLLAFALTAIPSYLFGALYSRIHKQYLLQRGLCAQVASLFVFVLLWDWLDLRLFPWSPVMSVGADRYLLASVGIFGTWGWRFLFFGYVAWVLWALKSKHSTKHFALHLTASTALIFGFTYAVGFWHHTKLNEAYAARQPIALIQGNVGNYEKKLSKLGVMPTIENVLRIHRDLNEKIAIRFSPLEQQDIEPWIIWPETSYPLRPVEEPADRQSLMEFVMLTRGLHIVGTYEQAPAPFAGQVVPLDHNIAALFHSKKGFVSHYRKVNLLAFGEYIPLGDMFPKLYQLMPFVAHFGRGQTPVALPHPDPKGPVFLPLICYEILDHAYVRSFIKKASAEYPNRELVLVNLTNDSWYGPTAEPFEHSLLSRWTSASFSLPMLRPTNTGLSQIVAPWGEVLAQGPRDEAFVIFGELPVKNIQRKDF